MEILYQFGNEIVIGFQNLGEWLLLPMEFFSFLGIQWFYLFVAPFIYWCLSPRLGIRVGLLLMISASLNVILKVIFHTPRPYWIEESIVGYTTDHTFGVPSGHAQNAVVLWGLLAYWAKRKWVWVSAIILVILISISRIYLGLHYPHDTVLGWLVGVCILTLYLWNEERLLNWLAGNNSQQKIIIAFLVSIILIGIGAGLINFTDGWKIENWSVSFVDPGFATDAYINDIFISDLVTASAAFFGMSAGAIYINNLGGFSADGEIWRRIVRFITGITGVAILYFGMSVIFPEGENLIAQSFRYIKYVTLGLWVAGIAPLLFLKLKLAESVD